MLHARETWPLTKRNLQHIDRAMIRQICSIKQEDVATVRQNKLQAKLEDLDLILRERLLVWLWTCGTFLWCSRTACDIQVDGRQAAYMEETDRELLPWGEAHNSWSSNKGHLEIRCKICCVCVQLTSDLEGGGAHWYGWCPCTCMLIKNISDYMYMMIWWLLMIPVRVFRNKGF